MISFCGYGFMGDGNSLTPVPNAVSTVEKVRIENAVYDDLYITANATDEYTTEKPTDWDSDTLLWADFEGDIDGGNIEFEIDEISSVRIKRRVVGEYEWTLMYEKDIDVLDDLNFIYNDYLNVYGVEYEYAWVPVLSGVEGNYVTETVLSKFNGVYITDDESIYRFLAGVEYGTTSQVQQVGTFEPFGRKYPIYVSNALTNYAKGSVEGMVLGNFLTTGEWDRREMVQEKNNMMAFLTNKRAKFIKDWNGNSWLVMVVDTPSVVYDNDWGMGAMKVGLNFSEIGDGTDADTLSSVGFIPTQQ